MKFRIGNIEEPYQNQKSFDDFDEAIEQAKKEEAVSIDTPTAKAGGILRQAFCECLTPDRTARP